MVSKAAMLSLARVHVHLSHSAMTRFKGARHPRFRIHTAAREVLRFYSALNTSISLQIALHTHCSCVWLSDRRRRRLQPSLLSMLRLLNDMSNGAMLFLVDVVFVLLSDYLNCLFLLAFSFHLYPASPFFPTLFCFRRRIHDCSTPC